MVASAITPNGFQLDWSSIYAAVPGVSFNVSCSPDTPGCSQTTGDTSVTFSGLDDATLYTITVTVLLDGFSSDGVSLPVQTRK